MPALDPGSRELRQLEEVATELLAFAMKDLALIARSGMVMPAVVNPVPASAAPPGEALTAA